MKMDRIKTPYRELTEEMVLKAIEEVQKKQREGEFLVFFPLNWRADRAIKEEMLRQLRKNVI